MRTRRDFLKVAAVAPLTTLCVAALDIVCTAEGHTAGHLNGVAAAAPRNEVIVGGLVSAIVRGHVKAPLPGCSLTEYAFFDLHGSQETFRCMVWPKQFALYQGLIAEQAMVATRATVERRPGDYTGVLIVEETRPFEELERWRTECESKRTDYAANISQPARCALAHDDWFRCRIAGRGRHTSSSTGG